MRARRLTIGMLLALSIVLIALRCLASAAEPLPTPENGPQRITLFLNSREKVQIRGGDQPLRFEFTPTRDAEYSFRFGRDALDDPQVAAALYRAEDDALIAQSDDAREEEILAELKAEITYTLQVWSADEQADGDAWVEVMLEAHGRSSRMPIQLPGETTRYTKKIIQPRDVHWYSFVAPTSGTYVIRSETDEEKPLDVRAYLLNEAGLDIAYNDDLLFPDDPNFCIWADLNEGEQYFVRVSAFSNLTGQYRLALLMPEGGEVVPEIFAINHNDLNMEIGQREALKAFLAPAGALQSVVWASSDYGVAFVSPDGVVTAVSPGETTITAIVHGGLAARCSVSVAPIPVRGIRFAHNQIELPEGDSSDLALEFTPLDATNRTVAYASSNPAIAEVDGEGRIHGVSEGFAVITAKAEDGNWFTSIDVRVTPRLPVYRALLATQINYIDGRRRIGALNTAQGIADAFALNDAGYQTRHLLDGTRAEFEAAVGEVFKDAQSGDISFIYLSSHGDIAEGEAYLELFDGDRITPERLTQMVRDVEGHVVLVLDFCYSGMFIDAFRADDSLANGKYFVIASAGTDQRSSRYGTRGRDVEAEMATLLGSGICEGLGWDLFNNRRQMLRADQDGDRQVTLQELYQYAHQQVNDLLAMHNAALRNTDPDYEDIVQSVQVYPEGSDLVIFTRARQ